MEAWFNKNKSMIDWTQQLDVFGVGVYKRQGSFESWNLFLGLFCYAAKINQGTKLDQI